MRTWCRRIQNRWNILKGLRGPGEALLLLRAMLFAAAVPLLFRTKPGTWSQWLERRAVPSGAPTANTAASERILCCVGGALALGRPLVGSSCLVGGVTRYYFLRRAGFNISLCFGAAMKDARPAPVPGHCWLEKDGEPVFEARDPRPDFLTIYRLPQSAPARPASMES